MHIFLKISQQTFWQIVGKVITAFSTFIVLALVARNYGEEGTGIYTLAITYLALFGLLSDFGFNAHVLKRIKHHELIIKDEWSKLLGARVLWSGLLTAVAVGLLPFWPFTTSEFSQAVILGSLFILLVAMFVTCNLIFQSRLRYDLSVMASSSGTLCWLVIVIWFIKLHLQIPFLVLSHLLAWAVIVLVALFLAKKLIKKIAIKFDALYIKKLFKESWPIAATLALNGVYFRVDGFILSYFKGVDAVGIYNVAYSLFQTVLVLPTFVMNSYYPLMLKSFKDMNKFFPSEIKFVAVGLLGLAGLGAVVTYSLSPLIIAILTGGGFMGSTESLRILSLGFPAYFLSALLMWMMVTKGKYQLMLMIYGLGLMVNLILNFIYIPQYSYLAASWVTVISEYLILGMQIVSLRKVL